jgi:hypothetical protein
MNCPAKKGMNLRLCGFGMPGQGFYSIQFPDKKDNSQLKSFPRLLIVFEGVASEEIVETELKYLFKGRTSWTISQLGDMEFILYFPSEELRFELTKFKSFEFATAPIKAKVEPTSLDLAQFKIVHHKKGVVRKISRTSKRVGN